MDTPKIKMTQRERDWYQERTGELPRDWNDVRRLRGEEFDALNPLEAKRKRLVIEYAESRGGNVLALLRQIEHACWNEPPPEELDYHGAGKALGLSPAEQEQIYDAMLEWVNKRYKSLPEYEPPKAENWHYPKIS